MINMLIKTTPKTRLPFQTERNMSFFFGLLFFISCSFPAQAAWLSMVGGNTIDGDQVGVNDFGRAGTMGGFAGGNYRYTLTRSGAFTTANLIFSTQVGTTMNALSPNSFRFFNNGPINISLSGIIPYGTECGVTETIVMKFYSTNGQLVFSNTFIIRNPIQAIPVSKFKIFGSPVAAPTLIQGCNCSSPNIFANNIKLQYVGTGTVVKYRVIVKQATAQGFLVAGGVQFEQNWVNTAVPATINLNTLGAGTTTGAMPTSRTYFLVTLETVSGPCSGGSGIHTALILLKSEICQR